MAQTIFLRMPISKSNLLLLTIAIISLMSYLLLRRSKSRTDDILVTWPSLKMNKSDFILNGKPLRILSGAIHYFRFYRGGPIIAFQIENEYGSFYTDDVKYMGHLKSLMITGGIKELLFTSDNHIGLRKDFLALPDVFLTVNFGNNAQERLHLIREIQINLHWWQNSGMVGLITGVRNIMCETRKLWQISLSKYWILELHSTSICFMGEQTLAS
ncbi:Beta-galactosidase-1-like protein 3 [Acropora cervicornis]|uniref:Beta-galactosidase-1-like protein 3 n=1 Tax=Acropora cervicornis TaxID=6130 RepID=A0AAD9VH51_ACRCE|nr:Beta-galactosidase-1-like protein 3 [Acropora cervicornis]